MAKATATEQPTPRRRFQRRPPTAEALADLDDQNVMGATAGFFCAVWAARLLGERIASALTRVGYEDPAAPGRYCFGPVDAAVVVLLASKVLFVRACASRYVLRPIARACLPGQPFEQHARLASALGVMAVRLLSVCMGLWVAAPVLAPGGGGVWAGYQASTSLGSKVRVLVLAAMQVCDLVVRYTDGAPGSGGGAPFPAAKAWLALAALAGAAYLGTVPLAGAAAAASDLPCLAAAAAGCGCLVGGHGGRLLCRATKALLFVAMWTYPPALLYAAVVAGPPPPAPGDTDAWAAAACQLLGAASVAVALLAVARMAAAMPARGAQ
ncbi:hypothetical protein LPJ61_002043 [Coemansia biformis]|uniref:Uncharacterized protein n=1 Tax=Coemansia biformis TaxID=1286918 RepID=A0A9W8CZI6_9FUNG|nr:hypothetical protein LPJ61_002043 [Coemansia biformis]